MADLGGGPRRADTRGAVQFRRPSAGILPSARPLVYTGLECRRGGRPVPGDSPAGHVPVECAPPRTGRAGARGRVAGVAGAAGGSRRRHPRKIETGKPPAGLFFWVGLGAHFCFAAARAARRGGAGDMGLLRERLIALIEPLLGRLGFELVDLEYGAGRAHGVLRLFIDNPAGISVEDCSRVSREVSALLDVTDPIPTSYTLEVSSPGFVELKEPRAGRRRYTGTLLTVDDGGIALEVDREQVTVGFEEIGKARLAPQEARSSVGERKGV